MRIAIALVSALGSLFAFALAYGQPGMMGGGRMMGMATLRRQFVMQNGLDPKFAYKANPLRPNSENLAAGRKLFEADCASCHGAGGRGDGPAAKALNPPPPDIAAVVRMPMITDAYLYWTIAEGGVPLHTAMPPFKGTLKDVEIWQVILYLRRL
jgi:mono/diheme cytochrome c family protein